MGIRPIRCIPALQEYAISTCASPTKHQVLTMSANGFLTNTITVYATQAPIAAVAAETQATASSLLQSNKILAYPLHPGTTWEATVSGTASSVGIGSLCALKNNGQGIQYSATRAAGGVFLIEGFNSDKTLAYGKLGNILLTGTRTAAIGGTT